MTFPTYEQLGLDLPIDLPGIARVQATIALTEGTSRLTQCATCGVAVAVPDTRLHSHKDPLGPCPRCGGATWWNAAAGDDLGPFFTTEERARFEFDHVICSPDRPHRP